MKRSEMVKELIQTLGAYDSWEQQCDYMLKVIEKANLGRGMTPPVRSLVEGEVPTTDGSGDILQHRTWEPE